MKKTAISLFGPPRCSGFVAAFTLVEAAIATAVVGLSIAGLLYAMASGDKVNAYGRDLTTASFLAGEIREFSLGLPFTDPDGTATIGFDSGDLYIDDIDDMLNVNFTPPIDGSGNSISGMTGWQQQITLSWLNPDDFSQTVAIDSSGVIRVGVSVTHNNEEITAAQWLVFEGAGP